MGTAAAAPGDLDPSFATGGKLIDDYGFGGDDYAEAVAVQGDGKTVVAGRAGPIMNTDLSVTRYNVGGSLDSTFSGDGRVTTDFDNGGFSYARALAIQPDGKIIVVGSSGPFYVIARYDVDGSLDPTFSEDGKEVGAALPAFAEAVAVQPDGKIVVAGKSADDFAAVRYNPDGSLDLGFSDDGAVFTDFGGFDSAMDLAIQPDGKIVAAGRTSADQFSIGDSDIALARYNPDGSLDTDFSGDGVQTDDFGSSAVAEAVALVGDGRIAVGGSVADDAFAIARYDEAGELDPTFDADGRQTTDFGPPMPGAPTIARDVAVGDDGKIVAVGSSLSGAVLARYNASGSLDTGFSEDGKQTTFNSDAAGVALRDDGTFMVAGKAFGGDTLDFFVARYGPSGALDPTFSGDGQLATDFGNDERGSGLAVQADGRLVVAGRGAGGFALARYLPNGSPDTTFGEAGRVPTRFPGSSLNNFEDSALDVVVQDDGKIVAVGRTDGGAGFPGLDLAVARYEPDGSPDLSFSDDGVQTADLGSSSDEATAVALQADGKILVVGATSSDESGEDVAVLRYNADGSFDNTFSDDGQLLSDLGGDETAADVALQADGKLVVAGESDAGFALFRYTSDGALDESFADQGVETTDFGDGIGSASAVAIQEDGSILAGGRTGTAGNADFALARYDIEGSLDASFAGDGRQTTDFGAFEAAADIAVQGDGGIVAGGGSGSGNSIGEVAVARYTATGLPDTTFSDDGLQTTDFDRPGAAAAVTIQEDGNIVAAGATASSDDPWAGITLTRYEGGTGPADTTPPETTITSGPSGATTDSTPTFEFASSEEGSSFECRVDTAAFASCSSPHTTSALGTGVRNFEVRAIDAASNQDLTPASRSFTVSEPPPPDSDGDGVPDASDACPGVPGTLANGCSPPPPPPPPPADGDGDGVADASDSCPAVAAVTANGCPTAPSPDPVPPEQDPDEPEPEPEAPSIAGAGSAGTAPVSAKGALTVPKQTVDCTGGGSDCKVTVSVAGRVPAGAVSSAPRRKKAKVVQLGRSGFTIKTGKRGKVTVKLNRKGLRLLKRRKRIKATVTITVTRSGMKAKKTVRVTLKAPKAKRKTRRR